MSREGTLPDFSFRGVEFGRGQTPWNLMPLLFKGGAGCYVKTVYTEIAAGRLGKPLRDRLSLVAALHEAIQASINSGASRTSIDIYIQRLRAFFSWVDATGHELDLQKAQSVFLHWSDALLHRQRVLKDIKPTSAYHTAAIVAKLLDVVLERPTPMIALTRLQVPPQRKAAQRREVEKQSLAQAFEFGHLLQDICDGLQEDVVLRSHLPVLIKLRSGKTIEHWSGWHLHSNPTGFETFESDGTLRTRRPLANLRIEAELLMFLAQTGMNIAQAQKLQGSSFSYVSYIDGYRVSENKGRRKGKVVFEVFKEYRSHFERYLRWRANIFPGESLLFPYQRIRGGLQDAAINFRIKYICRDVECSYVAPSRLRGTKVNWLLRNSADPELTAEMAQHTKATLLDVYERPSLQKASVELLRFWSKNDPTISSNESVAPGACTGRPAAIVSKPALATDPDCIRPSGCLWCEHHRDVDSLDYVWGLACFGLLKEYELAKLAPSEAASATAASLAMGRIREKLLWFQHSNSTRRAWVEEAHERLAEGHFHPDWQSLLGQMGTI